MALAWPAVSLESSMRELPLLLVHIAGFIAAGSGCTFSRGSCDNFVQTRKTIDVTADVACAIANEGPDVRGIECGKACGLAFACTLPDDYARSFAAANASRPAEAGVDSEGGDAAAGNSSGVVRANCPNMTGTVKIVCADSCTGRRTQGAREPNLPDQASAGNYFAACSYLEAMSVHAFARLHRELDAIDAPKELLAATERAMNEEARHAVLTRDLARRFGVEPEDAEAPPTSIRTRLEIACENAVEGCVRETFGAVLGVICAMRARDQQVRAVMGSIARDECEHAALSWRVAKWMMTRLDDRERPVVENAMREAVSGLLASEEDTVSEECRVLCGLATREERRCIVQLLDREVFAKAA
jgi:hypothetical protein